MRNDAIKIVIGIHLKQLRFVDTYVQVKCTLNFVTHVEPASVTAEKLITLSNNNISMAQSQPTSFGTPYTSVDNALYTTTDYDGEDTYFCYPCLSRK